MDPFTLLISQKRRRRLLNELLEAALQRAITRTHHHNVAVCIRQHLGLNVAGFVQVALHEALTTTKRCSGLTRCGLKQLRNFLAGVGHLHAAAAAAKRGLNSHGQAVLIRKGHNLIGTGNRVLRARRHRRIRTLRNLARSHLVAQCSDRLRRGANPCQTSVNNLLGKLGVLRQKAVTRVDRIRPGVRGGLQDLVHIQVGLRRSSAAEGKRLIGQGNKRGIRIGLRVDGYRRNTCIFCSTNNTHGDFAAVSNQDFR